MPGYWAWLWLWLPVLEIVPERLASMKEETVRIGQIGS